jgi:hypothetical protein
MRRQTSRQIDASTIEDLTAGSNRDENGRVAMLGHAYCRPSL